MVAFITGSVMWIPLWIMISFTTLSEAFENLQCCPNGVEVTYEWGCSDHSPINLDCSPYYPIAPRSFNITNGSLLKHAWSTDPLTKEWFCLGSFNGRPGSAMICSPAEALNQYYYIGIINIFSIVSLIFCIITLFVYIYLPKLRDLQDKSIMSFVASFGGFCFFRYSNWTFYYFLDNHPLLCYAIAYLMPFTGLASISWTFLMAFRIWQLVWYPGVKETKNTFLIYSIMAWGVPACLTLLGCIHNGTSLQSHCYYDDLVENWPFLLGPILILSNLNILLCGMTFWRLCQFHENTSKWRELKCKGILIFKLGVLMGVTWIFESLSMIFDLNVIEKILDIVNILQGLWIFIIMVATRNKVKKQLAEKNLFFKSWLNGEYEECSLSDEGNVNYEKTRDTKRYV